MARKPFTGAVPEACDYSVTLNSSKYNRGRAIGERITVTSYKKDSHTFACFVSSDQNKVNQPRHSMTAADCRMWKTAQGKATDILQQAMVDSQRLRETKEPGKGNGHSRSTYGMHKLSAYGTLSQGGRAKSLLVKASPLAESLLANAPNRR